MIFIVACPCEAWLPNQAKKGVFSSVVERFTVPRSEPVGSTTGVHTPYQRWALSSVVERSIHIGKVTGSIPVVPTKYAHHGTGRS